MVSYTTSDGLSVADEPFESLSDGYRVMVGMVADIARRMATLNPALEDRTVLETPGVVLIDEVDLHLHPLWQRQVVETLLALFPQVQFIVTTHAPMVISSVHRNQVRQLSCDTVTGQARAVTPSYETYGQSASDTLDTVQEADSLPLPVRRLVDAFADAFDADNYQEARECLRRLGDLVGEENSEFAAAQTALRFMQDDVDDSTNPTE